MSPVYRYLCPLCDARWEKQHSMADCDRPHYCDQCLTEAVRIPQAPNVNWNGPAPSDPQLHPRIKNMIDTLPERQDKFAKQHEEHERRTANE